MSRLLVPFLLAPLLAAQTTGVLSGHVSDPSGARVPRVSLSLVAPSGAIRPAETDSSGSFSIAGIASGDYAVRASAPGFGAFETRLSIAGGRISNLEIQLQVAAGRQEVSVAEREQASVDPASNAAAVSLQGADLDLLSGNADDLQSDLQALAGPAAGPNGGQILVDGFTNGQLPPKDSIREIRINANPFSAEFERSGQGRIEIFTKPGTDRLHGNFSYNVSDNSWNSRNPFSPEKPYNRMQQLGFSMGGALTKKISFNLDTQRNIIDDTNFINALVLDDRLEPARLSRNIDNPNRRYFLSPRLDIALTQNQTLQMRFTLSKLIGKNNFASGLNLPSRGNTQVSGFHAFILTHTAVLGTRAVNESRYSYQRQTVTSEGNTFTPTVQVLDAFTGGGAMQGLNSSGNLLQEFQNYTTYTQGKHLVKFGVRVRGATIESDVTSNFNGTYTFTSIGSYAITERGLAQGLTIPQIRALGGGARQYSVSAGDTYAGVSMWDASPFLQDDWRARPNLTVSLGLRYEWQTNIRDRRAIAPRLGIAWGLGKANARSNQPKTVLRAGFGAFYERFPYDQTLRTIRQDGVRQQNFVVLEPQFYPQAPPASALANSRLPQAIYKTDAALVAPAMYSSAITLEHQFPRNLSLSLNYYYNRGTHQLRARNINAPLPGTFTGAPGSGVYPLGNPGQLFLYESSATFKQSQLFVNLNARVNAKVQLLGYYAWGKASSDSDGSASFPANNYDLGPEFGRAGFDIRHRLQFSGNLNLPAGLRVSPSVGWNSAPPFNITSGVDLNGDTNFNDRPAFATDLSRPSVRRTPWGNFDIHPLPSQTVIPRNFGTAFSRLEAHIRASRTWNIGETPKGAAARTFTLGVSARNFSNYVNRGTPVGNLSSALFGQVLGMGAFSSASNRRIDLNARIDF